MQQVSFCAVTQTHINCKQDYRVLPKHLSTGKKQTEMFNVNLRIQHISSNLKSINNLFYIKEKRSFNIYCTSIYAYDGSSDV